MKNVRAEGEEKVKKEKTVDFYDHCDHSSCSDSEVGQSEIDDLDLKNIDADSNLPSLSQQSKRCKGKECQKSVAPEPSAREAPKCKVCWGSE